MEMNKLNEIYNEELVSRLRTSNQTIRNESAEEKKNYLHKVCDSCYEEVLEQITSEIPREKLSDEEIKKARFRIDSCFDELKRGLEQIMDLDCEKRSNENDLYWSVVKKMENVTEALKTIEIQKDVPLEQEKERIQEEFLQVYQEKIVFLQNSLEEQREDFDKEASYSTENAVNDMVMTEFKHDIHTILSNYELEEIGELSENIDNILCRFEESCLENLQAMNASANQNITAQEQEIFEQIKQECLQVLGAEIEGQQEQKKENNNFKESLQSMVNEDICHGEEEETPIEEEMSQIKDLPDDVII